MPYILFKDSKGEIIKVLEGVPYRRQPDWVEIGSEFDQKESELNDVFAKIGNVVGISVDETITRLTKALGIKKCPVCHVRGEILKKMGQLGWVETMKRLKATFKKNA